MTKQIPASLRHIIASITLADRSLYWDFFTHDYRGTASDCRKGQMGLAIYDFELVEE
jgi:hypothetical protein